MLVQGRANQFLTVHARALGRVLHRQVVQARQQAKRQIVDRRGLLEWILLVKELASAQVPPQVGRQHVLDERLECLAAHVLGEVHPIGVALVASLAVLERHHRIVSEGVEPGADQRVAALHLVIQEAEGERAVHGLDPQAETAELHRQRVQVHAVDAPLHHVTA